MPEDKNKGGAGLLIALLIGALIKFGVVVAAWLKADMDLNAPVRMRTFLFVQLIDVLVLFYLLYIVTWGGSVAVFS